MSKLIATSQLTLMNLTEKAIERTEVTFWHGLSATKHPLGVYDCGSRDHAFANEFDVVSGKKYTVRIIAQRTKGAINLKGGIWYTERTSGYQFDGLAALTQVGELSEDGLGIWERTLTVPNGKIKGRAYVQLEQSSASGFSTAYRVYDAQVFDENEQPLVTDQNNFGALTSPMAAPGGTYIWKRTITYYTDGTNDTVWEYSGVGEKGNTGANGQTSHVHFAFADNATGGGFSLTTPKAYMGWYADFNEAASTDPTKYRWGKWKGDQGLPGKPGADGRTPYLHTAYANSADGRTDFSTSNTDNKRYLGTYTDYTQADSTDPSKYKWVDMVGTVKGGSRNYFKNSLTRTFYTTDDQTFDYRTYIVDAFWENKDRFKKDFVKISFDITFPVALEKDYAANIHFSATPWYSNRVTFKAGTTSRQHFEFGINLSGASEDYYTNNVFIRFGTDYGFPSGFKIILENMMLSIGSYYPDYIQAIEDAQEQIDSKADQELTQEQLNALAEKNALIQAEMEAKASMDTVNQWITAYQNYVNANNADKKKSEQALQDASNRLLQVQYDVKDLKQQWDFIDTYMSVQNEGLIIGKKDGSAYAKFSNDRISLFSGNSEVMYISQGTLNIANGIFTKTIQIGRFRFETHPADVDMLVIRYLGG